MLMAGGAGFLLNGLIVELLDGVGLVFGGLFYLLVARFLGPYYAIGTALIVSSRTLSWGHPYGIIIFSMEGFVAGWLCRRRLSLWLADLLYWLGFGVPLLVFLFSLGIHHTGGWVIVVKQPLNGLLDVALVELLLLVIPVERWLVPSSSLGQPRPFRSSLFSAFVLVATLPLVFLNVVGAHDESTQHRVEAEERLQQLAFAVGTATQQRVSRHIDAVAELAVAIRAKADFSTPALNGWLEQAHGVYGGFLTMIVTDREGAIVASYPRTTLAGAPLAHHSVADRDYFREVIATHRSFVSGAFRGRGFGTDPIIAISAPLVRRDGGMFGVLEGSLNLTRFESFAGPPHAGSQQAILLDKANHVIAASSAAGYAALTDLSTAPFVELARQQAGNKPFRYEAAGKAYIAYSAPMTHGWLVVTQVPVQLIQAAARREYARTVLWALIAIALSLALADLASRRITRPLQQLVDGFRSYTPGGSYHGASLTAEAPVEAHALISEFTRLAGRLDDSYSDLRRAKDESGELNQKLQSVLEGLDRQVRERTAELAEASALLLALVDSSPIAIIVVARDLTVKVWNPAAERIFGWTRDELMDQPLPAAFGSAHTGFRSLCEKVWNGNGNAFRGIEETSWRNKNAGSVDVSVAIAPLRAAGAETTALLTLATDITERKRSEEERLKLQDQLQRAQKLESIGRLAGGVAHDFNNLLTVINGYSELLLVNKSTLDGGMRKAVEQVRYAGEKAATLTQQLLAFSRKQIARVRPLNLNQLIRESAEMLQRLLGEDIHMVMTLDPALGAILADAGQIHQVLINMGVNARDAMPDGGTLTVATRNVEVTGPEAAKNPDASPGPFVVLSVTDSGVGMDQETQAHIFEPFFTTKPGGLGTGLGLSTAYGIITQSGGWISVESEPGRGATFFVYLPRVHSASTADGARPPVPSRLGTETVLIVEDEPGVRTLAADVLRASGYRVLTAESGEEALAVSAQHGGHIDVLLTDLIMPGITGRELAIRLSAIRPGVGILYMSGYAEDVIAHRGKLEHGVAFLAKPFAPVALLDKVREVIAHAAVP